MFKSKTIGSHAELAVLLKVNSIPCGVRVIRFISFVRSMFYCCLSCKQATVRCYHGGMVLISADSKVEL